MTLAELNGHLDMVTQLHSAREDLQTLQDRILGAQQYDGMPHGHDAARKVENLSILLKEKSDDVDRLERIVDRSEKSVRKWVSTVSDTRVKTALSLRYLCGMKWDDVADYIGGEKSVESVKAMCYRLLK